MSSLPRAIPGALSVIGLVARDVRDELDRLETLLESHPGPIRVRDAVELAELDRRWRIVVGRILELELTGEAPT